MNRHCECHERDSSYVCDWCFAEGARGHVDPDTCTDCQAIPDEPCSSTCHRRQATYQVVEIRKPPQGMPSEVAMASSAESLWRLIQQMAEGETAKITVERRR